jgi:hypothetical protein
MSFGRYTDNPRHLPIACIGDPIKPGAAGYENARFQVHAIALA